MTQQATLNSDIVFIGQGEDSAMVAGAKVHNVDDGNESFMVVSNDKAGPANPVDDNDGLIKCDDSMTITSVLALIRVRKRFYCCINAAVAFCYMDAALNFQQQFECCIVPGSTINQVMSAFRRG